MALHIIFTGSVSPQYSLVGEKIGLRAIEKRDLPILMEWRNQPEYRQYFREYRELSSLHQEAWFENKVIKDDHTEIFAIVDLENGELLGACGLCYIDWINRNADFSIYIRKDGLYIDEVYAVDAARVMMKYGFEELNLHRLWAEIYDFDTQKQKMFDTLGFAFEGRHKEQHWTEGKWCDSMYYGMVKSFGK